MAVLNIAVKEFDDSVQRDFENEIEFYELLDHIACQDKYVVYLTDLWSIKDELIQFFVDKGYVKEIKIGGT